MSIQIFRSRLGLALFHGFHYGFMLCAKYFLLCGHLFRSSDLRFMRFSPVRIWYFSLKHKLQVIFPGLYGCAWSMMSHFTLNSTFLSFNAHIRLANSVCFLCLLFLNDDLCCVNLVLKVVSVIPM